MMAVTDSVPSTTFIEQFALQEIAERRPRRAVEVGLENVWIARSPRADAAPRSECGRSGAALLARFALFITAAVVAEHEMEGSGDVDPQAAIGAASEPYPLADADAMDSPA